MARPSAPGPTTTTAAGGGGPTTTTQRGGLPSPTTTTTASAGGCPDPRGCPNYYLIGGRWPRDTNGVTTIHYRVRPDGNIHNQLTPGQVVAAIQAAAQTWMDAVPSVRLVYDGTTTTEPSKGNNVVGWGALSPTGVANTDFTPTRTGPTYTGFSITLSNTAGFTWRPCDPPKGQPCDDDNGQAPDLQGVVTHEFGHALGLAHPPNQPTEGELTMFSIGGNTRHYVTLGLGDILGARSLYPTDAPIPTLYRP